jgi:hypothetical protein
LSATDDDADLDARAHAIHERVLTLDSHVDVLLPTSPAQAHGSGQRSQADLDRRHRRGRISDCRRSRPQNCRGSRRSTRRGGRQARCDSDLHQG